MATTNNNLFTLGQIVATPQALQLLSPIEIQQALDRHRSGDWGDCCAEDQQANDEALRQGDRIFSVYHTSQGEKFWIITEADRSSTTVLLPSDY